MSDGSRKEYGQYGKHINYYAYGQAGMSLKVTGNNQVIMGAPGLLQWTGGIVNFIFSQNNDNTTSVNMQAISNPYYTKELGPDDYFGKHFYLYLNLKVLVYQPAKGDVKSNEALDIRAKLRGPQLGSYFGASLCCLDIDGDGAADLLVGAPNYAKKDSGLPGARFGTAIADLADVDGDGFRGVVYIYRGYAKGLRSTYNQRILAEGAGSFGISIARGFDVDNNNCNVHTSIRVPDAMNLPHNATGFTALFCVTLPEMPLWPHVTIVHTSIRVPDAMNLPHNATGFTALFCVTLPEMPLWPHVAIEYRVSASPGNERCDEQTVEVKPTADLSKPISIKFELEPDEMLKNDTILFNKRAARVSVESELECTFLIQLVRDCGEDMICTPWLVMTLEALDNPYIPGTETKLGARLTILNKEEPAYGARVNISLPLIPKRVPSPCSLEDLVMICDVPAPLLRDEKIIWDIELEYNLNSSTEVDLKVVAELEDSLYYRNISKDLIIELVLEVTPEASFNVTGKSLPNATIAVSRDKLHDAENITFTNYVEIMNLGPSDWYHLEVEIIFDVVSLKVNSCQIMRSFVINLITYTLLSS
ncbi:Hemocyte-specific integrin alpha subunit 3 [Operophtera brumata]|uniref:Hemocyte-specific integrin alpha subunit 3 n=1 Tax=Operophtera brumata TaxID=104452 RepID=A0A0L7LUC9_OPEBR|nr:Hemocyte-specific integrin alpha subunit 3 [Operophtera brumata]